MQQVGWTGRAMAAAHLDRRPLAGPPTTTRVVTATAASLGVSLGADALLVVAGTALFPATRGYAHFRFSDYATLTVLGVVAAGAAWPVVARVSSAPRWLYLRLAVVVSVVLLAPDGWLLAHHEPVRAVAVLVAMHGAIAVATYNVMVRGAPAHLLPEQPGPAGLDGPASGGPAADGGSAVGPSGDDGGAGRGRRPLRAAWVALLALVSAETVSGVAAIVAVPYDRSAGWVPATGRAVYLVHAVLGGVLGVVAAGALLAAPRRCERPTVIAAVVGLSGVVVGAGGGVLAVAPSGRLLGMGLMLLGVLAAGFAYLAAFGLDEPVADTAPAGDDDAGGPAWDSSARRCRRCGPAATATPSSTSTAEQDAADRLAAGGCPLCPTEALRPRGAGAACRCCGSSYRRLPGADADDTWVVTPGAGVTGR